jgi:hypothetical protein
MIETKDYISGSQWWINSANLSFEEIVTQSRIPDKWSRYNSKDILNIRSVLKPVNNYVLNLYPKPKILSIHENLVTFRQRTHAEIWVEEKSNQVLYALDKCHQRQFYPSLNYIESDECFKPTYRFYIPWFINKNIEINIYPVEDEETPFYVNKKNIIGTPIEDHKEYANTDFVDFKIKNTGPYYLKEKYAIISKDTAMYDMSAVLSDEEISQIKDYYGQQ